jgi:PAS domain S-box-containing protein
MEPDFTAIFEATPAPCLVVAPPEFRIVAVNEAFLRATLTRRDVLLGRALFEAFPDDPSDPNPAGVRNLRESLERVVKERCVDLMAVQRHPIPLPTHAGFEARWWAPVNAPVIGPDGEVAFIVHRAEDVTDIVRRRGETEAHSQLVRDEQALIGKLRDTESILRRVISIDTVGVLFFDLQGRVLDANRAFERMSGYGRDELRRLSSWRELTPKEFREATERAVRDLADTGTASPYEKQLVRRDGARIWGLCAPTRLTGAGRSSECVEFIIDISESKRTESALHEADRRKDEFLATLGHELRNPLAPLRNGLLIARRRACDERLRERTFEMMERQLDHLVRLVDDLLDVGRITAGKIELRRTVVSLREVLATSIEDTRGLLESQGHVLELHEPAEDVRVDGDFDRLTQVFSNILSNAAKYTERGGRIGVALRREGAEAVVRVTDSGIGILQAAIPHVFDLFSQVSAHQDRKTSGLGIGLALANRLMGLHGGTLSASSQGPGRGSTFTVRLAAIPDSPGPGALAHSEPAQAAAGARRRILVADDNPDAVSSLATLLELEGHEVVTARDGLEAVAKASRFPFEIAFLDLGMPGMNGLEAARLIRRLPGRECATLVALTGWGQDRDRERTRAAGFNRHLVKPASEGALRELLRAVPALERH